MGTVEKLEFPSNNEEVKLEYYLTKGGEVPFWDHPLLKGYKVLPDKYYPSVTLEGVLSLYRRRRFDDIDITLLKVLGDAICCNEDQLRRYMASVLSRSDVSKRLNRYREVGLADRWKMRIRGDSEEEFKPPAPFTLGIAGFKLLKHYYNDHYFMNHNRWDDLGTRAIQRYVSMNELRCSLIESKAIKNWKWNAIIANNRKIKFPFAAAEIVTPKGNLNLLIDRAQTTQDFVGYFRSKFSDWKKVYAQYQNFPITELPENLSVIVVYTSTLSVAKKLHEELMFDTLPFKVWVCVEEDLLDRGLAHSFYVPQKENLKNVQFEFMQKN